MQNYLDLNVVIIPDKRISEIVTDWSKRVEEKFNVRFTLDGITYHPHISIYQTRYPKSNLDKISQVLKSISESTRSFQIDLTKLSEFLGFIFYDCENNNNLQELHEVILKALNPLREGMLFSEHRKMLDDPRVSHERKDSILRYGYPLSFDAFSPHITVSRLLVHEDASRAMKLIPFQSSNFQTSEIALAYTDHDGTCKKIIERYNLK